MACPRERCQAVRQAGRSKRGHDHVRFEPAMLVTLCCALLQIAVPPPRGYVNDFAGVLDAQSISHMESLIAEVREKTRGEIAVVTLSDIGDRPAADMALEIGRRWGAEESPPGHGSDLHRHRSRRRGVPHGCARGPDSRRHDALPRAAGIRGGAGARRRPDRTGVRSGVRGDAHRHISAGHDRRACAVPDPDRLDHRRCDRVDCLEPRAHSPAAAAVRWVGRWGSRLERRWWVRRRWRGLRRVRGWGRVLRWRSGRALLGLTPLIPSPFGPHPLSPFPFRRGGTKKDVSSPLSRRERGKGGEDVWPRT
ncbi:MAG: TPM domain-containing protein [Chloroflexi bacterium]|nr:MAG: TPM domain-containing protein [Chloroflexota bacterium]